MGRALPDAAEADRGIAIRERERLPEFRAQEQFGPVVPVGCRSNAAA
jgi:hypothetical protein